jgi:hypothetical protein
LYGSLNPRISIILACIIHGRDKFKQNFMEIILENAHFENQGGYGMRYQDDVRIIIWSRRRWMKLNQDQNCGFGSGGFEHWSSAV